MSTTVYAELAAAAEMPYKAGQDVQDYLKKLLRRLDKVLPEDGGDLSQPARDWFDKAAVQYDNKADIALPDGLSEGAATDDDESGTQAADEPEEDEQSAGTKDSEEPEEYTEPKSKSKSPKKPKERPTMQTSAHKNGSAGKAKSAPPPKKTAAPTKKAAATKPAAKKGRPAREAAYPDNAKIKILCKGNPKRPGSAIYKRFALLKSGMTVGAAREAGVSMLDLTSDVRRGHLEIK